MSSISPIIKIKRRVKRAFNLLFGKPNKPSFIIIGAQKAGTDALMGYLKKDSRLFASYGESSFFSTNNYNKGINWYHELFRNYHKGKMYFEKTPEYIYYPEVPKRIFDYNKNIKLIVLLRDPVKRAYSGWNHYRKYYNNENEFSKQWLIDSLSSGLGMEKGKEMIDLLLSKEYPTFSESINLELDWFSKNKFVYNPSFITRGLYVEQLKRFYKYFDKSQILVLESDEFRKDKNKYMNEVYNFIGLTVPEFDFSSLQDKHKSKYKVSVMKQVDKDRLSKFYLPYNNELFKLLGKEFKWN